MICPECGNPKTKVLETRAQDDGEALVRRRQCCNCEARFNSYECYERADVEASFDAAEMRAAIEKALAWLAVPARHIPIVRDSVRVLKIGISADSEVLKH